MPMTKREAERLAKENGARFMRHGASHDLWMSADGEIIAIPRHPKDFTRGVEHDIKSKLGIR
jgi:predicted RNA binding protein YcfA (HicA-like mRNA interferase family)